MKYIYTLLILMLAGCGQAKFKQFNYISTEIYSINKVLSEVYHLLPPLKTNTEVTIHWIEDVDAFAEFVQKRPNTTGLCSQATKMIGINKDFWNNTNIINKKALLLHELGHCLVGLNHTKEANEPCDGDIMHGNTYCSALALITSETVF